MHSSSNGLRQIERFSARNSGGDCFSLSGKESILAGTFEGPYSQRLRIMLSDEGIPVPQVLLDRVFIKFICIQSDENIFIFHDETTGLIAEIEILPEGQYRFYCDHKDFFKSAFWPQVPTEES